MVFSLCFCNLRVPVLACPVSGVWYSKKTGRLRFSVHRSLLCTNNTYCGPAHVELSTQISKIRVTRYKAAGDDLGNRRLNGKAIKLLLAIFSTRQNISDMINLLFK